MDAPAPAAPAARAWPILTQQPRVPWSWVVWIQFPWFGAVVFANLNETMMAFTLRKHTSSAWLITLLISFNVVFSMIVGAACNHRSDQIWTRWGRRRPFLVPGHLAIALFLVAIPNIERFWVLVITFFVYELFSNLNTPVEPLEKEVVPVPQRGRGMAITQLARVGATLFFSAVLLAQFDRRYVIFGHEIGGERVAYWTGALVALAIVVFYGLGVREMRPVSVSAEMAPPARARTGVGEIAELFRAMFGSRHNRVLCIAGIAGGVLWTNLGSLAPLLITEQFGYSKMTLGWINAIGQSTTLLLVLPVGGWIVDKADRLRLYQLCIAGMLAYNVAFYAYARYFAPGGVPPVGVLVGFSIFYTTVSNLGTIAAVALLSDFIATSQMGTVYAAIGLARTLFILLSGNAVGCWVSFFSSRFASSLDGHNDYLSGYHFLIPASLAALVAAIWFGREVRSGRLVAFGLAEQRERLVRQGS